MPVLEARHLTKRYATSTAVEDLSFSVEQGSVVGFLGPNGSGKSTTLRMFLGLVAPTTGEALVHGVPYHRLSDPVRQVGGLLEARATHPSRTARNHLRVNAAAAGISMARVDEVLALTGLVHAADRKVSGFSLGMHQRLGLANALLGDPELLLLDEPTNGLDPAGMRWMREFILAQRAQGRTVLVSSHLLHEVADVADRVVVVNRGRLVADSTLAELTAGTAEDVRVLTAEPLRLAGLLEAGGVQVRSTTPDAVVVNSAFSAVVGQLAAANEVPVAGMVAEAPDLESVFLRLTGGLPGDAGDFGARGAEELR